MGRMNQAQGRPSVARGKDQGWRTARVRLGDGGLLIRLGGEVYVILRGMTKVGGRFEVRSSVRGYVCMYVSK